MPRFLVYVGAILAMGTIFAATMVVAAIVLGLASPSTEPRTPQPLPTGAAGPAGTITITAFDLGFEPAMVHVPQPGCGATASAV